MTTITEKLAEALLGMTRALDLKYPGTDHKPGYWREPYDAAMATLAEYEKEYGYRMQSEAYAAGLAIHEEMADDKSWTMVHGWHEDFNGTCLQGEIDCSYADLVKVFGKETSKGDEYKTQAEWLIRFPCGTVASIYDYKQGKKYNGADGIPKTKVRDWHIGGRSFRAAELVRAAMAGVL